MKAGIRKKVDVVTTSYISPAIQELEPQINEAGICVMNEIGLGILIPSSSIENSTANVPPQTLVKPYKTSVLICVLLT